MLFLGASMCITAFPMLARNNTLQEAKLVLHGDNAIGAGQSMMRPLGRCLPWC